MKFNRLRFEYSGVFVNDSAEESVIGITGIARVVHESVRAYKNALKEDSLPPWDEAPDWQKNATKAAVEFRLKNPTSEPSHQHEQWMAEKISNGWKYGEAKDAAAKTHPLLLPYSQLPVSERLKDRLVQSIIDGLFSECF